LPAGSIQPITPAEFTQALHNSSSYFISSFGAIENVPHAYCPAPKGFPDWLVAMNFPNNVNNEGILIDSCTGKYCAVLPVPVFPTSLYEAVICVFLFAFLWIIRRKQKFVLQLFGIYLIANGVERFLIEKIKVNYRYDWGAIHPAQSEIIAILLMVLGMSIMITQRKKSLQAGVI